MNRCLVATAILLCSLGFGQVPAGGVTIYESAAELTPGTPIDAAVFKELKRRGISPAKVCSDSVFVRRVYLDVIGTLPTAAEARDFLADRNPRKRAALIDKLLERKEFADYWAMKWSDLLRIKAEFPINLWPNAAQAYYKWVSTSIRDNKRYDQFARELLTSSGSNFREPPVNFYRAMQSREPAGIAQAVALMFMGARVEKWPTNELAAMAGFFSQVGYKATGEWKEEIVFWDRSKATSQAVAIKLEENAGPFIQLELKNSSGVQETKDPRVIFADWLITPENPWFTKNIANRVWSWFFGRGIIHEPDDIRPDNPPVNPELLACLERELIASHYDLKHLYRMILNSQTYQLSSVTETDDSNAAANFAAYPVRRLDAEVLIDAVDQITGTSEKYSSPIPEPFTFLPDNQRSVALPDGSISSAFLELFGRPPRDTGLESERNNKSTANQALHLLNSSHIQRKIEQCRMVDYQTQGQKSPETIASGIYLGVLSRYPTPEEVQKVSAYFAGGKRRTRDAAIDLVWALINTPEFLYRH